MDGTDFQIWLKAIPLEHAKKKKEKSDVLFSSDLGKKSLFEIFKILKSEVKLPLIEKFNPVELFFGLFADDDLSTDLAIKDTINNYMKNLMNYNHLVDKIKDILILLRMSKVKFWGKVLNKYLTNEKINNEELKKLWLDRRSKLVGL